MLYKFHLVLYFFLLSYHVLPHLNSSFYSSIEFLPSISFLEPSWICRESWLFGGALALKLCPFWLWAFILLHNLYKCGPPSLKLIVFSLNLMLADNLKDLLRFLRRDDPQNRQVFKQVCKWNTASKDLIPIIENCQSDHNLVLNAGRLALARIKCLIWEILKMSNFLLLVCSEGLGFSYHANWTYVFWYSPADRVLVGIKICNYIKWHCCCYSFSSWKPSWKFGKVSPISVNSSQTMYPSVKW